MIDNKIRIPKGLVSFVNRGKSAILTFESKDKMLDYLQAFDRAIAKKEQGQITLTMHEARTIYEYMHELADYVVNCEGGDDLVKIKRSYNRGGKLARADRKLAETLKYD